MALGLTPIGASRTDAFIEFEAGASRFALHAIPAELAAQIDITSPPVPREVNPVKLIFDVPHPAAEAARLESLGVTMIQRPWGTFDVVDPEGNIFGLAL